MHYITEDEARKRFLNGTGASCLEPGERLTQAAAELLRANHYDVSNCEIHKLTFEHASSIPVPGPADAAKQAAKAAPANAKDDRPEEASACKPCIGRTHLDADTMVHKSHPRIELRGRMDTLISTAVVVQTQFDTKNRLPELLRTGLADVKNWMWQMLCAEASGQPMPAVQVCGMSPNTIRAVSLDPVKFLGQGHVVPDAGLGQNVALLNWLRAQTRELEVLLAKTGERDDLLEAANRLSTAVYVLVLLTVVAEQGRDITKINA